METRNRAKASTKAAPSAAMSKRGGDDDVARNLRQRLDGVAVDGAPYREVELLRSVQAPKEGQGRQQTKVQSSQRPGGDGGAPSVAAPKPLRADQEAPRDDRQLRRLQVGG